MPWRVAAVIGIITAISTGALSVAFIERVPLWQFLATMAQQYPTRMYQLIGSIMLAISLTAAASIGSVLPRRARHAWMAVTLLVVMVAAMSVRGAVETRLNGVSGGDPYNYLSITRTITEFNNPFAAAKRLPGYPAVLLPAFLTPIDDIWWMRAINITAAGVTIALIGLLAHAIRLPWPAPLLAAALLALQKDFFWTSLRPEPYTFYTAVLLGAATLFFYLTTPWRQVLFGLLLGYAAIVRQEGFVAAAVLGSASLLFWRQVFLHQAGAGRLWLRQLVPARTEWRVFILHLLRTYLPALLVVLPFFVTNWVRFNNPFYTPYFEGERLQIVNSWPMFLDSLGATWGVLGTIWWPVWERNARVDLTHPVLLAALTGTIIWWAARFFRRDIGRTFQLVFYPLAALLLMGLALWFFVAAPAAFAEGMLAAGAGALLASAALLALHGWRAAVLFTLAVTQALIALWFHPFTKHYQQVYPLLCLALAAVAIAPGRAGLARRPWSLLMTQTASIVLPIVLTASVLAATVNTYIDISNQRTAADHVVYEALNAARRLPGPHGFDLGYQAADVYFGDTAAYYAAEQTNSEAERAWLNQQRINTLVVTTVSPHFRELPPGWEQVFSVVTEGRDEQLFRGMVFVRTAAL